MGTGNLTGAFKEPREGLIRPFTWDANKQEYKHRMDSTADEKEKRSATVTEGRCEVKRSEGMIARSTAGTDERELTAALAELIEEEKRSETECENGDSTGRETKLTEGKIGGRDFMSPVAADISENNETEGRAGCETKLTEGTIGGIDFLPPGAAGESASMMRGGERTARLSSLSTWSQAMAVARA